MNLRQELRTYLATINTVRHSTTGQIPFELYRGHLLRGEGKSAEEETAIISHIRELAHQNTITAAEICQSLDVEQACEGV